MTAGSLGRAIAAATEWLMDQDAPEAAIAAHETGRAESDRAARRWVGWILDEERDGAWNSDLLATVRALLTVQAVREAASLKAQDPAIGRALDWIRGRKGRPGMWTDGCTPERHGAALCHHFAGGFYSPAPPDQPLSGVRLPAGTGVAGDTEARFSISAYALRCTLLWRESATDARLHMEVLRRVVGNWSEAPPNGLTTIALLAAIHALLASRDSRDHEAAALGLQLVAGTQRGDGSWVDADPFHAMAVLDTAAAAGVGGPRVDAAIDYAARLLAATQQSDGSWGVELGAPRALIGLRTLRRSMG